MKETTEYKKVISRFIRNIVCNCGLRFNDFDLFETHVLENLEDKNH